MISSAKCNMFEVAAVTVAETYAAALSGHIASPPFGTVVAISNGAPNDQVRNALEKSFAALGFGEGACIFADASLLGENDLYTVLEGLDPLRIVACDAQSAALVSRAYRQEVPTDAQCHVGGRPAVAFRDLAALMNTPETKQTAWLLLKKLDRGIK